MREEEVKIDLLDGLERLEYNYYLQFKLFVISKKF